MITSRRRSSWRMALAAAACGALVVASAILDASRPRWRPDNAVLDRAAVLSAAEEGAVSRQLTVDVCDALTGRRLPDASIRLGAPGRASGILAMDSSGEAGAALPVRDGALFEWTLDAPGHETWRVILRGNEIFGEPRHHFRLRPCGGRPSFKVRLRSQRPGPDDVIVSTWCVAPIGAPGEHRHASESSAVRAGAAAPGAWEVPLGRLSLEGGIAVDARRSWRDPAGRRSGTEVLRREIVGDAPDRLRLVGPEGSTVVESMAFGGEAMFDLGVWDFETEDVSGVVVDARGNPAAGVDVTFHERVVACTALFASWGPGPPACDDPCATTGPDGRFAFRWNAPRSVGNGCAGTVDLFRARGPRAVAERRASLAVHRGADNRLVLDEPCAR